MDSLIKKFSITIFLIITISVTVFHFFAGLSIFDSVYFVITVITTVGLGDINLLNQSAPLKLYGNLLMILGAMTVTIGFGLVADYLLGTRLKRVYGKYNTKMKGHTILIGWNKTVEATLEEIKKVSSVCIITSDSSVPHIIDYKGVDVIIGEGIDTGLLEKAGIKNAKNVVIISGDDSKNIMTTLMVRKLNPNIHVISAASEALNIELIKDAGADEVISPDMIGGRLITSALFEKNVLELLMDATAVEQGTNIEEIKINKNISVKEISNSYKISVLEKVVEGARVSDLTTNDIINKGDVIIVFGYIEHIERAINELGLK